MSERSLLTNLRGALTPDPHRPWAVDFIPDAALAMEDGRIQWLGARADLPEAWRDAPVVDGRGRWAAPGFVDPHTHLLFGGDRSGEFNRRLQGASYQEIASGGGGIRETVRATRLATVEELDRHREFLTREAAQLRGVGKRWAADKADKFDKIAELLRQIRQDKQMQGVAGRVGG